MSNPSQSPIKPLLQPPDKSLFHWYCGDVLLRKAVFSILILDLSLGFWYVLESLLLLSMLWLVPGHFEEVIVSIVNNALSVSIGLIAILGLCGLTRERRCLFALYCKAKVVELAFSFFYCPSTSHKYCPEKDLGCQAATLAVICLTKIGVNALCVYVLRAKLSLWPHGALRAAALTGIQLREIAADNP